MVSKNNFKNKMEQTAARTPHYGIRKLSVGVASVLISTTLYMGATTAKADTLPSTATDAATINPETASSSSSTRTNTTADNTAKATVPTTASSTDTSVSTTPNAQASTTNTTAGATSSDKSSANNNTLVTNNVEPTVNTTAQAQPKPNVVTSDKANVDNQVGSNVENKATTTTDTISAPTTPKRVVRSLVAAPTTNSKELVENQDYTVSNVSLEDHKKQDNFDEDATFLHADIKAKNGDVIANTQNQTVDITYAATRQVVNGSWTLKYVDKNNHDKEILPSTNIKLQFARNLNADQKTYGDWYIVDNSLSQTGTNLKVLSLEKTANDTTEDGFNRDNFSIKVQLPNSPSENYRKEYGTFTFTWGILNDRDQDSTMENTSFVDYPEQKKITITYVDDDGDGEVISKESLTGDIGTEVKTFIRDYSGYALNGDYPQTITMTNDTKDIIVHMKHKTETRKVILDLQLFLKRILLLDNDKSNIEITAYDEQGKNSSFSDFSYGKIPFNITIDLSNSLVANVSPADGFDISQLSKPFTLTQGSTGDFYYSGKTLSQVLADYVKEGKLDKSYLDNPIKAYASYKGTISNANISNHNTFKKYNNIFYNADGSLKDNYLSIISTNGEKLGDKVIDKITIPNSFFTPENIKDLLNNYHYNLPIFGFDDEAPLDIPFEVDYVPYAEKQVTRTINIKNPDGTTKKIVQTATIDRKVIFNGEGNADWSTGSFDSYDVPVIEGYTASQSKVDTATVTSDTQNSEVNVTYTANPQSIKINYVDDEKGGATVKSDTLNGKTDQTVKTGITIPENYSVVGTTPSEYTFKANGNTDITVHLKHVIDTTSEEKTVTRTIKITDPTGKVTTIPQTTKVTRTVSTDKVTNQKTYGDWTSSSFDSYDVPTIEGYTASQSKVDEAIVDGNSKDSEVNISYTANDQAIKINYVDSDNNDSVVKSDTLNGKTDQTVKTNINIPEGYTIEEQVPTDYIFKASGNTDITVKLKHGTTTVTPDNPSKNYPSGVGQNDLNKTVTRTIKITDSQGKVTTETQTVHLTRTATVDEVTGDITYGDWSTGSFDSYDVPVIEGYTASQSKVDTATVTSDTQNSEVNITYTANDQAIKINYVDSDNNGSVVKSDTLSGKTDQTVKTGITIPDGYVIEGNVPTDYTFKASGNTDITVKLKHGTTTVTPDKPKTTGDKLPDNPSKNYPSGVAESDLNKTVTRTIKVTDPQGKVTTTTQTVHLTRTATVDEVTGDVTYSDWSTGSFDSYDVPVIEGYTATQSKVDTATVTSDTQNSEVNVTYTANPQSIKINYVDDDKGGATVKSDALNGKTDETVKTGITIPENYTVVGTAPSDYTFKAKDNADITVHLKHVIDTTSEEKTITRTIKVTNPNGGVMTIPQSAKSTRTVSTDKVTGEVTYGDWSKADLDGYDVPLIEGYTASQSSVAKTTVDGSNEDNVVEINYTPNKQVISIDYVDNGKVIATQVLTGKTDQTVKTNIQSPDKDKYVLVGNNPESYTFKAKDNADIRVEVKHVINDSTESKDVTRTIIVTRPDGKETTEVQKATVSRTVHTDAVTGAKTYDEWSKATLDKYDVPVVNGYTPSLNVVERLEVDGDSKDSVVKVGYTANEQTAKIVYVDGDNGNSIVKSDTLTGKTDETVKTGVKVPDGYVIDGNVPTDYTFKVSGNPDITVKLKHGITTVTPDKPKTTNDKLPDNPSKSYPEGVSENDLNKTVTRTIKVTDPKGKVTTTTQTVHLTRTATVDEVTGEVTYSDWSTGKWDNYKIPAIEGYDSNVDQVDGQEVTFDTKNQTVEVSYTKLVDPDRSTTPVKEENNTETPKQSQDKVQSKFVDTGLPQTGEKDNEKVSVLGAVIASLAAGLGLAGIRRKKDKN